MNKGKSQVVIYWDASAILSTLIKDIYSEEAQEWARQKGTHLFSSLAYAEVIAVISRMQRERVMSVVFVEAAIEALENGPWRRLYYGPTWNLMIELSQRWSLRGADLWHLSTAKSICEQLPEVKILTFDKRLKVAAQGEGIGL